MVMELMSSFVVKMLIKDTANVETVRSNAPWPQDASQCRVFSLRVPDDSDSQSGPIRQRQNCLESRRVEGQEMPVLTLAPCVGTDGVAAVSQVGPEPRRCS